MSNGHRASIELQPTAVPRVHEAVQESFGQPWSVRAMPAVERGGSRERTEQRGVLWSRGHVGGKNGNDRRPQRP